MGLFLDGILNHVATKGHAPIHEELGELGRLFIEASLAD